MGTLLAELASREILTGVTVKRLREYISNKYPQFSPALRAGIFSDAVNRIVAAKLPELPGDKISLFRAFLYSDAAKKQTFSIDCSDIFKSSLRLRTADEHFVKGLKVWLEDTLLTPVLEDRVFEYVQNACRILDETPHMEIEKVLESIESKVGDIRPKKRVISLVHMNPAGAGSNSGALKDRGTEASEFSMKPSFGTVSYEGSGGMDLDIEDLIGKNPGWEHCGWEGAAKKDSGRDDSEKENVSEDWILIRRRKSAGEIIADRISRLAAHVAGIYNRATGFIAGMVSESTRYRNVATAGLITAALLCTFLWALYVNAVSKAEQAKTDDILMIEETTSIFEDMTPLSAAVGNDVGRIGENGGEMIRMRATAYDLSVESCGKDRGHPEYGITYSGTRAEAGRTVAVDPEVIPLGSSIRITFPEEYSYMDGIYVAEDTGRLIKGNNIDIFFGEDQEGSREINRKALQFGIQYVDVEIMDDKQVLR